MKKTLYMEIYKELKDEILEGKIEAGEKLPSDSELIERFGVSIITLKKSMELLNKDGLIVRRPGLGTIVKRAEDDENEKISSNSKKDKVTIGLVMTHFDDTFGTDIVSGIIDNSKLDVDIVLKKSLGNVKVEEEIIKGMIESNVDGIILLPCTTEYISPYILQLASEKYPIVIIDRKFDGIPISCVWSDNVLGSRMLVKYLFEKNHKNIALVSSRSYVSTVKARKDGFIKAFAELKVKYGKENILEDIKSIMPLASHKGYEEDIELIKDFINKNKDLTAIVAIEYNIALLCSEACKELQRDIEIVCFDHPKIFTELKPYEYTHIKQSQYDIGKEALKQVLTQIKDNYSINQITIEPKLFISEDKK